MQTNHAFTLIELLVVVLIIGILAAVALPQYQIAVAKSRYATLKEMTKAFANAQEIYYLANGTYSHEFAALDIDTPGGVINQESGNNDMRVFEWGKCRLGFSNSVQCYDDNMGYQIRYIHASNKPSEVWCIAWNRDLNSAENKVCKQETQLNAPSGPKNDTYYFWRY